MQGVQLMAVGMGTVFSFFNDSDLCNDADVSLRRLAGAAECC